jgi:phytoene dehydrogenase-like protein
MRTLRLTMLPVRRFGEEHFSGEGGRRLLAGNALHADLTPETALGGFFGFVLCALGQDVGFPVPQGGAGMLTRALVDRLRARGGTIECNATAERIIVRRSRAVGVRTTDGTEVEARRAVLAAVDAPQLYLDLLDPDEVGAAALADIRRFEWDWSTIKIDWTLVGPIPWDAPDVRRSPVVHITEGVDALTLQSSQIRMGQIPERPFLIFGQYSPVDASRQPEGKETAWAYTHVPQRVRADAGGRLTGTWDAAELSEIADRCEREIERLAPGFRSLIRRRAVAGPAQLEGSDANLRGGALNGGTAQMHQQLVFRPLPGVGRPGTPIRHLYLASASAHPGGGVHGGPGAIAARAAINERRGMQVAMGIAAGATGVGTVRTLVRRDRE